MSIESQPAVIRLAVLGALLLTGCQHVSPTYRNIDLDGFSDSNYQQLNQSIGTPVCIRGRLIVSSMGLHFALQPVVADGVIDPGYSSIITGLGYDYALRNKIVDGGNYRVCGTLREVTPLPKCNRNDCRWYELVDSRLR